ncbi:DUF3040 domain-containing protein [Actinomadura parmotrematis]|uniref:DUF3040 domain-containing protein n=1 Tax=Actinomadura parmotrematis TaxID=2864039 RepID=A0ABS7FUL8_9ACTN|nr:DUF3040 domain-containing protein [Actinomadura parmotrematis]MBW8483282.1 DUF3040 domain-containing protein [Actinomadura parmotrematis]
MELSQAENRVLEDIGRRIAAEDPGYAARLSAFGGYEGSALGMPSRWTLLPVVIVGLLMVAGLVAGAVLLPGDAHAAAESGRAAAGALRH